MNPTSTITCPHCSQKSEEKIPYDKSIFIYQCKFCELLIVPSSGSCCVFCDYGSKGCDAVEEKNNKKVE